MRKLTTLRKQAKTAAFRVSLSRIRIISLCVSLVLTFVVLQLWQLAGLMNQIHQPEHKQQTQQSSSMGGRMLSSLTPHRIAIATYFGGLQASNGTEDEIAIAECTRQNKQEYAAAHGYIFLDEHNYSEETALPLLPHMTSSLNPFKQGRFQKLRFLIQMLDLHPDMEWLLWTDTDAVITDVQVTVEQKVQQFEQMFAEQVRRHNHGWLCQLGIGPCRLLPDSLPLAMVMAQDHNGINSGVFLIRNNDVGRQMLRESYETFVDPAHGYADQKAMMQAIFNQTSTLHTTLGQATLLLSMEEAYHMQSYMRSVLKKTNPLYWKPEKHPWTLHMPHSRPRFKAKILQQKLKLCQAVKI